MGDGRNHLCKVKHAPSGEWGRILTISCPTIKGDSPFRNDSTVYIATCGRFHLTLSPKWCYEHFLSVLATLPLPFDRSHSINPPQYLVVCWAAIHQATASSLSIDPRIVSCSHSWRGFIKYLKLQYFVSRCNVIKNTLSLWRWGIQRRAAAQSLKGQRHSLRAVAAAFRGDVLTFASRDQLCLYCTPPPSTTLRSIPQVPVEETQRFHSGSPIREQTWFIKRDVMQHAGC